MARASVSGRSPPASAMRTPAEPAPRRLRERRGRVPTPVPPTAPGTRGSSRARRRQRRLGRELLQRRSGPAMCAHRARPETRVAAAGGVLAGRGRRAAGRRDSARGVTDGGRISSTGCEPKTPTTGTPPTAATISRASAGLDRRVLSAKMTPEVGGAERRPRGRRPRARVRPQILTSTATRVTPDKLPCQRPRRLRRGRAPCRPAPRRRRQRRPGPHRATEAMPLSATATTPRGTCASSATPRPRRCGRYRGRGC